jgi:hypothetical protein
MMGTIEPRYQAATGEQSQTCWKSSFRLGWHPLKAEISTAAREPRRIARPSLWITGLNIYLFPPSSMHRVITFIAASLDTPAVEHLKLFRSITWSGVASGLVQQASCRNCSIKRPPDRFI